MNLTDFLKTGLSHNKRMKEGNCLMIVLDIEKCI
jgi:hypothetical protein